MKLHHLIYAATSLLVLGSCSQEQIEVYQAENNGVYFNYKNTTDLEMSVNFSDHVLGNPSTLPVNLRLKVMGVKANENRRVVLKSRSLEGKGELQVICPEIIFTPDTIEKEVTIHVARPEVRDSSFAAVVYIDSQDSQSQIGSGLAEFQEFTIHAKESYSKPASWGEWSMHQMYLGDWSVDKHIFLINLTRNNRYFTSQNYQAIVQWNTAAVDSLRRWKEAHINDPVPVAMPFIPEDGISYNKPWYWGDLQTKYLGAYATKPFAAICNVLGITTQNEYETFATTEDNLKNLNKDAVKVMMQRYNTFYYDGWRRGSTYKNNFFVPMFGNLSYVLVKPAAWGDDQGGADMIKRYYGEYSPEKYEFMIKTWLSHKGADFVLNQLFPVMNEWGNVSWDSSLGGENAIREINRVMRTALEGQAHSFTFPEI